MSSYDEESILYEQIEARIDEANFVLSAFSTKQLETNMKKVVREEKKKNEDETVSSRRSFLGNASLKGVVKHKMTFDEAVEADELKAFQLDTITISKIREKNLPDKRKILFTTLKHADVPEHFDVLAEEDISFVSQKFVNFIFDNDFITFRILSTWNSNWFDCL